MGVSTLLFLLIKVVALSDNEVNTVVLFLKRTFSLTLSLHVQLLAMGDHMSIIWCLEIHRQNMV